MKELNLILKTDVQGSIEPLKNSVERLGSEEVKVRVIRSGSGNITESDVLLAIASKAIIIGFNTTPEPGARRLAETEGVDIRSYDVIYNLVEDIQKAMTGMLEPVYQAVVEGHAEVIAVFSVRKHGKVAGARVTEGKLTRGASARLIRNGQVIKETTIDSLRHFKDDVREMTMGFECGLGLVGFDDFQVGDIIEAYRQERVR
jgi:translation initiation factor IF-2